MKYGIWRVGQLGMYAYQGFSESGKSGQMGESEACIQDSSDKFQKTGGPRYRDAGTLSVGFTAAHTGALGLFSKTSPQKDVRESLSS